MNQRPVKKCCLMTALSNNSTFVIVPIAGSGSDEIIRVSDARHASAVSNTRPEAIPDCPTSISLATTPVPDWMIFFSSCSDRHPPIIVNDYLGTTWGLIVMVILAAISPGSRQSSDLVFVTALPNAFVERALEAAEDASIFNSVHARLLRSELEKDAVDYWNTDDHILNLNDEVVERLCTPTMSRTLGRLRGGCEFGNQCEECNHSD
jgi:hypothetical protein